MSERERERERAETQDTQTHRQTHPDTDERFMRVRFLKGRWGAKLFSRFWWCIVLFCLIEAGLVLLNREFF